MGSKTSGRTRRALRLLACLAALAAGAAAAGDGVAEGRTETVRTGAQLLAENGFAMLAGRRVGLIANHTTRVEGDHLADRLHAAPDVTLAALFAPEHGLRGLAAAGERITHGRDDKTGVPVHSLYGETRRPTPAMLRGLDVLVFDIQDAGARFYTYTATMGLAMQAAARAGLAFLVLDRPNPLGGDCIAGFTTRRRHRSFVSQYPLPQAHGLTVGELARMIRGEDWLPGLAELDLRVVAMRGWRRDMLWPDTGLSWTPPSPNLPDFETALVYPGAGLFEAAAAGEGRGTDAPFRLLGAAWANGRALADALNARNLPGARFAAARFTPRRNAGAGPAGEALEGVRITVTDARVFAPVETGVHLLHAFREQARARGQRFIDRPDWLAKLAGTARLHALLREGAAPERIIAAWQADVEAFRARREPYLLYP